MFKNLLTSFAVIAICSLCTKANAQSDTSHYDLGRIKVKKDFVQTVTIKGEDLEKFPSTSLSDALSTWLSGVFTTTYGVVYVIDGDVINDVNAYSIFDIEEATLIENAATSLNGTVQQQSMVLIKTRTNRPGKSGITVAGQTNITDSHNPITGGTSKPAYYHQYYISAYKNINDTHFGLSADYQHDAFADNTVITSSTVTSERLKTDQLKFYGYFDTKIGNNTTLGVSLNYASQADNPASSGVSYSPSGAINQNENEHVSPGLLNTKLSLASNLLKGLTNNLSFNYNNVNSTNIENDEDQGAVAGDQSSINTINQTNNNFLLRDNLQYEYNNGNWHIEPSLNFSFRYSNEYVTENSQYINSFSAQAVAGASYSMADKLYLLIPSVNIYYKNIFNVQGGMLADLKAAYGLRKLSPFMMLSVDALRLTNIADNYSWQFFGSYANSGAYDDQNSALPVFNSSPMSGITNYSYTSFITSPTSSYHSFNNYQAGTVLSFFNKKLSFAYNYESRQFVSPLIGTLPGGTIYLFPLLTSKANRLSINASIINTGKLKWFSSINASNNTFKFDLSRYPGYSLYNPSLLAKQWTGGWVNRFDYGKFMLGADMLYEINEPNSNTSTINSFVLQNAYVGYHITTKRFKQFDVYANTRNLAKNTPADITDGRKFYGLGFKVGF